MNIIFFLLNILLVTSHPVIPHSWIENTSKAVVAGVDGTTKALTAVAIEKLPGLTDNTVKAFTEAGFANTRKAHRALKTIGQGAGKQSAKNFKGAWRASQQFNAGAREEFGRALKEQFEKAVAAIKALAKKISTSSKKWLSKIPGLKSLRPTVEQVVELVPTPPPKKVNSIPNLDDLIQMYNGVVDTVGSIQTQVATLAKQNAYTAGVEYAKFGIPIFGNRLTRELDIKTSENIAAQVLHSSTSDEIIRNFGKDFAKRAMKQPLAAVKLTMSAASGFLPALILEYSTALKEFAKATLTLADRFPTETISAANHIVQEMEATSAHIVFSKSSRYTKLQNTVHEFSPNPNIYSRLIKRSSVAGAFMEETAETLAIANFLMASIEEFEGLNRQLVALQNVHFENNSASL
jgi:hypothetical protein